MLVGFGRHMGHRHMGRHRHMGLGIFHRDNGHVLQQGLQLLEFHVLVGHNSHGFVHSNNGHVLQQGLLQLLLAVPWLELPLRLLMQVQRK